MEPLQALSFWANMLLAATFIIAPTSVFWLWLKRHKDWHQSWALLVVAGTLFAAGCGRMGYAYAVGSSIWMFKENETKVDVEVPIVAARVAVSSDAIACTLSLICSIMLPITAWKVYKLPTPAKLAHIERGHAQKKMFEMAAAWEREQAIRAKEQMRLAEERLDLMKSLVKDLPLDPTMKDRLIAVVQRT